MLTPEATRALFEKRHIYWKTHDAAALASDHAEECIVESPLGGVVRGRSNIESIYRSWFQAFPDTEMDIHELVIEANKVALVVSIRGTHVGEFCGLSSTGRAFKIDMVCAYTLEESQIVYERRIYDFTGVLLQLGVLKAKPGF